MVYTRDGILLSHKKEGPATLDTRIVSLAQEVSTSIPQFLLPFNTQFRSLPQLGKQINSLV